MCCCIMLIHRDSHSLVPADYSPSHHTNILLYCSSFHNEHWKSGLHNMKGSCKINIKTVFLICKHTHSLNLVCDTWNYYNSCVQRLYSLIFRMKVKENRLINTGKRTEWTSDLVCNHTSDYKIGPPRSRSPIC